MDSGLEAVLRTCSNSDLYVGGHYLREVIIPRKHDAVLPRTIEVATEGRISSRSALQYGGNVGNARRYLHSPTNFTILVYDDVRELTSGALFQEHLLIADIDLKWEEYDRVGEDRFGPEASVHNRKLVSNLLAKRLTLLPLPRPLTITQQQEINQYLVAGWQIFDGEVPLSNTQAILEKLQALLGEAHSILKHLLK